MKYLSCIILLIFLFLIPSPASAQTCGVFQKKVNDFCVHFDVPSNARLTYSGNSWDCNRGFKRSSDGGSCEEIKIPSNATGNLIGSFYCNSGFEKIGDECKKVLDVENSRFYEFGADFYCSDGYQRNEAEKICERMLIPQNARVDDSSLDGWSCNNGYIKEGSECKKFTLPEHAFWSGNYWKCEPGYRKNPTNRTCDKISIPENAYSTDTYDGWLCNSGYTKNYRDNRCDKIN